MARADAVYGERMGHHNQSIHKRTVHAALLIIFVLAFGTVVLHYVEGYSYTNAFYFMSMLATAEGPNIMPQTFIGKIFVSIMAFVSVGSVIFALAYIFGPTMNKFIRIGESDFRNEEAKIKNSFSARRRRR